MARYASDTSGINPLVAGGAGFGAGVALDRAGMALKQAKSRANWALGIGVGLTALAAVSASDLSNDQGLAQSTVTTASALTFTSAGVLGPEAAALRSVVVQQGYILQKIAYDASLFSFSGEPNAPNLTNPAAVGGVIGGITQTNQNNSNNNNSSLILLALAVIVVVAIVMMD